MPGENHENLEILRISYDKSKNRENIKIPCDNHEHYENYIIP